jgi:hypothetical protein
MTTPKELADKAKQQAHDYAHGLGWPLFAKRALHITIDQLQAMAEAQPAAVEVPEGFKVYEPAPGNVVTGYPEGISHSTVVDVVMKDGRQLAAPADCILWGRGVQHSDDGVLAWRAPDEKPIRGFTHKEAKALATCPAPAAEAEPVADDLAAKLYKAEGQVARLANDLAASRECVSRWIEYGVRITEALGHKVIYPDHHVREIAELVAARTAPQQQAAQSGVEGLREALAALVKAHDDMHAARRAAECDEPEPHAEVAHTASRIMIETRIKEARAALNAASLSAQQATGSGQVLTTVTKEWCRGWDACRAALAAATQAQPEDFGAMKERSDAWDAVCAALDEASPSWRELTGRGVSSAVKAIGELAAPTTGKREPLSDPEIDEGWQALIVSPRRAPMSLFKHGVRFAEKRHGITGEQ